MEPSDMAGQPSAGWPAIIVPGVARSAPSPPVPANLGVDVIEGDDHRVDILLNIYVPVQYII